MKTKYKYILKIFLMLLVFSNTSCLLVENLKSEDNRTFASSSYFAKHTDIGSDSLIFNNMDATLFSEYNSKVLPITSTNIDSVFIFKFYFNISKKMLDKELMLFLPSPRYPQTFYFNGDKIHKTGYVGKNIHSASYGSTIIYLSRRSFKKNDSINELTIKVYPTGERSKVEGFFIGEYKDVKKANFFYNILNVSFPAVFVGINFFYFGVFFFFWIFTSTKKNTHLYFSLFSISLMFGYFNMVFSTGIISEILFWKISRIGMTFSATMLGFFIMEYTGIGKNNKLLKKIMLFLAFVFTIAFIFQNNKMGVHIIFNWVSNIIALPVSLFTPILLIVSYQKNKNKYTLLMLFAITFFLTTVVHDIFILESNLNPYAWLIPFGYLVMEFCFAIILGYEHGLLERELFSKTLDLVNSNIKILAEKDHAQNADKAKHIFLKNMAHEFRTPLSGLESAAHLFKENKKVNKEEIDLFIITAKRITTSINSILDYTELDDGQIVLEPENFKLNLLLDELLLIHKDFATEKSVGVSIKFASEIPNDYFADKRRILSILVKILNNAIKYSNNSNILILVDFKHNVSNKGSLNFKIIDKGVGIPQNLVDSIFLEFQQVETTLSRNYEGVGLGLSIAFKLAKILGGTISVESVLSKGSTFEIDIPINEYLQSTNSIKSLDNKELDSVLEIVQKKDNKLEKKSVLVVEDNLLNRKIISRLLSNYDVNVDTAVNGLEGVEKVVENSYSLVLMDVQMPEMNGLDATEAIREYEKTIGQNRVPIIALTANATPDECLKVGMDDFMLKPINPERLTLIMNDYSLS